MVRFFSSHVNEKLWRLNIEFQLWKKKVCGECSYSWLSVCHQFHSLSKISSFLETVFLSICWLGVRFGYFNGQDTWEFLYCGATLLLIPPSYLRFYGSLDETGPHRHIYMPGSHLVNCLEGLSSMALLEEVWRCWRKHGLVGGGVLLGLSFEVSEVNSKLVEQDVGLSFFPSTTPACCHALHHDDCGLTLETVSKPFNSVLSFIKITFVMVYLHSNAMVTKTDFKKNKSRMWIKTQYNSVVRISVSGIKMPGFFSALKLTDLGQALVSFLICEISSVVRHAVLDNQGVRCYLHIGAYSHMLNNAYRVKVVHKCMLKCKQTFASR